MTREQPGAGDQALTLCSGVCCLHKLGPVPLLTGWVLMMKTLKL